MWLTLIYKYKKPLIWLTIIVAVVIIVIVWKNNKDKKKPGSEKAMNSLEINEENLTITKNQAILISENLLGAMNKYGTDTEVIISNLKTLRHDDLLFVLKMFGIRPYNGAGLGTRIYEKMFFSTDLNLIGWLQEELDGEDLNIVKSIFETNDIPF